MLRRPLPISTVRPLLILRHCGQQPFKRLLVFVRNRVCRCSLVRIEQSVYSLLSSFSSTVSSRSSISFVKLVSGAISWLGPIESWICLIKGGAGNLNSAPPAVRFPSLQIVARSEYNSHRSPHLCRILGMIISLGIHEIYVPFCCNCNMSGWCNYIQGGPLSYICGTRVLLAAWLFLLTE